MSDQQSLMQLSIFVVDDDPSVLRSVSNYLQARGHHVQRFTEGSKAIDVLAREGVDIVITDVQMPEMNGFEVLKRVKEISPRTEVIMITAFGDVENAVKAMREGAFDFFSKPFKVQDLSAALQRTVRFQELRRERDRYETQLARLGQVGQADYGLAAIIGEGDAIGQVREQIVQVAQADHTSVLIGGETGTGKELVARAIHYESARAAGPFVAVDCSAIPESLMESVFYGHVKGAFTDAKADRAGHFEAADGGTLFLDEIGDMDIGMQAKLLRTLEERKVRRLGGSRDVGVDIRVVSATNRDLLAEISKGSFRQDLFFRLNTFQITLPSLRQRVDDIPILAQHFLTRFATEMRKPIPVLSADAEAMLAAHPFLGNVRELRNLMERAMILCQDDVVMPAHMQLDLVVHLESLSASATAVPAPIDLQGMLQTLNLSDLELDGVEKAVMEEVLLRVRGHQGKAADSLGLSRDAIRRRMVKYGLLE
ncbi:MAG: two-component system response regulator AtoC [Candidatus Latescibacterota bacterium]|jgi:two-component system response regulator AtoC